MALVYSADPVDSSMLFASDPAADMAELETPTLSFRQLRVALPQFLFEELFESNKASKRANSNSPSTRRRGNMTAAAASGLQAPVFQPSAHAASYFAPSSPPQSHSPPHPHFHAQQTSPGSSRRGPAHQGFAKQSQDTASSNNGRVLIQMIEALPKELRSCFTEWRRDRKDAIAVGDLAKQAAIEQVMWGALSRIQVQN